MCGSGPHKGPQDIFEGSRDETRIRIRFTVFTCKESALVLWCIIINIVREEKYYKSQES